MTAIDSAIYAMGPIFAGPTADGTNGQVLVTDGAKQLSFTTIVSGVTALNSLTGSLSIAVGTSGSDVAVSASGATVTVNIPDAGASARGVITTGTQVIAGAKTFSTNVVVANTSNSVVPLAVNLASSQTADAVQVTSYGGTAGDLGRITANGEHIIQGITGTGRDLLTVRRTKDTPSNMNLFRVESDSTYDNYGYVVIGNYLAFELLGGSETAVSSLANPGYRQWTVQPGTSLKFDSPTIIKWTSTAYRADIGTVDTGLARNAAGIVEINNGTAGTYRDVKIRKLDATEGVSAGPITFAVLNATTATATLGAYRITDRANRLAYPDGTNWRFVSDDAIIS